MGAILDEVRSQDNVPRSVRRKSRDIARAREALTRGEGRAPSDQELAEELEVDLKTFWRWQSDVEGSFFVSLDQPFNDDDRRTASPSQSLPGMTGEMIENDINHFEEVEMLREAIMQLKEQERIVLSLYYFEELKLHQIGTILQLTESRVSQIHSRAIAKLRGNLSGLRAQAA
jgi:RNA polymerase sigma factor for flagellar operon FliA